MAWVRIHDGAMVNLKITALTDSAFRLWVRGLSYCQTALTDGLIPYQAIKDLGAKRKDVEALSTPQVPGRAPLWEPHVVGYKVHDYLLWNDCREKVVDRQSKAKERKDAWEANRKAGRVRNSVQNAVQDDVQNATRHERTTKPNQTKPSFPTEKRESKKGHARHSFCPPDKAEGFCVPEFLHMQLATMLGAHGDGFDLLVWYVDTDNARRLERPTVGDPIQWWRDELKATMTAKGWLKSTRSGAVPLPKFATECPHEPRCDGAWACTRRTQSDELKKAEAV